MTQSVNRRTKERKRIGKNTRFSVKYKPMIYEFIDDKGRLKQKSSGHVANIPNIHLAQALLLSIAKSNLETRRRSIRESFKK